MQLYVQQQLSLNGFKKQTKKVEVKPQPKSVETKTTHIEKTSTIKKEDPVKITTKPVEVIKKEQKASRFNITEGLRVIHKAFGEGTIVKLEPGRIHVKFDDPQLKDAKIFQNPQAFENGFLKLK